MTLKDKDKDMVHFWLFILLMSGIIVGTVVLGRYTRDMSGHKPFCHKTFSPDCVTVRDYLRNPPGAGKS